MHRVVYVYTARRAERLYRQLRTGLVVYLGPTGFDTLWSRAMHLAQLRAQPQTAAIPVVLMSAAGHLPPGAAFNAVIAKPFTVDALVTALQRCLP